MLLALLSCMLLGASSSQAECDSNELLQTKSSSRHVESKSCGLRDPSDASVPRGFEAFDHGSSYQGLYASRKHNFAFCLIEKNACKEWNSFISRIESTSGNPVHHLWDAEAAQEVFSDPHSVRAVFVRDPLERFLSAFLDKCTDDCHNQFCFPRTANGKEVGTPVSFQEAIDWLTGQNASKLDGHFKLQAYHCELYQRLHEYNAVGMMTARTLGRDAACLLETAGLKEWNTQPDVVFDREFNGSTMEHETAELLKQYYTPEAAQAVMKAYAVDYDLFGLAKPSWVDSARGELINQKMCGDTVATASLLSILDR